MNRTLHGLIVKTSLIGLAFALAPVPAAAQSGGDLIEFTVEVAEDFNRFVPTLLPGDTEPSRGSFFLTSGWIFPEGTIQGDDSTFDPQSDGAIGRWLCRGTHLANASEIISGKARIWVVTTQNFLLPGDARSLATEGREGSIPVMRAVIGGTGPYRDYVGEQRQELIGFNTTGGVNLRVTFTLRRRTE